MNSILLTSVVTKIADAIERAVSDFFISILVYAYYYCGKILPVIAALTVFISILLLITVYGAKSIRRKAIIALIVVPLVCFIIFYTLAVILSFRAAS